MDLELQELKRRAGVLKEDDVIDLAAKRQQVQAGKANKHDALVQELAQEMQGMIGAIVQNMVDAYIATCLSAWHEAGQPGKPGQFIKQITAERGYDWAANQTQEFAGVVSAHIRQAMSNILDPNFQINIPPEEL